MNPTVSVSSNGMLLPPWGSAISRRRVVGSRVAKSLFSASTALLPVALVRAFSNELLPALV